MILLAFNNLNSVMIMYQADLEAVVKRVSHLLNQKKWHEATNLAKEMKAVYSPANKHIKAIGRVLNKYYHDQAKPLVKQAKILKQELNTERFTTDYFTQKYDYDVLTIMNAFLRLTPLLYLQGSKEKKRFLSYALYWTSQLSDQITAAFDGVGEYDSRNIFTYLNSVYFFTLHPETLGYDPSVEFNNKELDYILNLIYQNILPLLEQLADKESAFNLEKIKSLPELKASRNKKESLQERTKTALEELKKLKSTIAKEQKASEKIDKEFEKHAAKMASDYKEELEGGKAQCETNIHLSEARCKEILNEWKFTNIDDAIHSLDQQCGILVLELGELENQISQIEGFIKKLGLANFDFYPVLTRLENKALERIIALEGSYSRAYPESILRAWCVVGEMFTLKILTPKTRNAFLFDAQLLVKVRNGLIHVEWYLAQGLTDKVFRVAINEALATQLIKDLECVITAARQLYTSMSWQERSPQAYYSNAFKEYAPSNELQVLPGFETLSEILTTQKASQQVPALDAVQKKCWIIKGANSIAQEIRALLGTLPSFCHLQAYQFEENYIQLPLNNKSIAQLRKLTQAPTNRMVFTLPPFAVMNAIARHTGARQGTIRFPGERVLKDTAETGEFDRALKSAEDYHNESVILIPQSKVPQSIGIEYDHMERQKVTAPLRFFDSGIKDEVIRYGNLCIFYNDLKKNKPLFAAVLFHISRLYNLVNELNEADLITIKNQLGEYAYLEMRYLRNHYAHGHDFFMQGHDIEFVTYHLRTFEKLATILSQLLPAVVTPQASMTGFSVAQPAEYATVCMHT